MATLDKKIMELIYGGTHTHRLSSGAGGSWRYNGKPSLCRKCGMLVPSEPWRFKCRRDEGHACELESVTAAEERRLLEVRRMLAETFGSAPRPKPAPTLYEYWWKMVMDTEGSN